MAPDRSGAGSEAAAPPPVGARREVFRPPTSAPVLDPFQPPPQPWLPGNRGIEYGTAAGDPITAIGRGRVAFAGPVAGRLVISIDHPGGLRSTYTGLAEILVERGQVVGGGEVIGRSGGPFHHGVKRGDQYLDPASLWGRPVGGGRVVLVPDRSGDRRGRGRPARGRTGRTARHLGQVGRSSLHSSTGPSPDGPIPTRMPGPLQRSPPNPVALGVRSPKPLERSGP